MIAFVAGLNGCMGPTGDIADPPATDDPATEDAALGTQAMAVARAASYASADAALPAVSCELINDPKARAACAACLAVPPTSDGGIETCEPVDVAGSLGPTSCCVYRPSDEAGTPSCESIFTYDRMAFVGSCPPAE